jgi:hypothetical protein
MDGGRRAIRRERRGVGGEGARKEVREGDGETGREGDGETQGDRERERER